MTALIIICSVLLLFFLIGQIRPHVILRAKENFEVYIKVLFIKKRVFTTKKMDPPDPELDLPRKKKKPKKEKKKKVKSKDKNKPKTKRFKYLLLMLNIPTGIFVNNIPKITPTNINTILLKMDFLVKHLNNEKEYESIRPINKNIISKKKCSIINSKTNVDKKRPITPPIVATAKKAKLDLNVLNMLFKLASKSSYIFNNIAIEPPLIPGTNIKKPITMLFINKNIKFIDSPFSFISLYE